MLTVLQGSIIAAVISVRNAQSLTEIIGHTGTYDNILYTPALLVAHVGSHNTTVQALPVCDFSSV